MANSFGVVECRLLTPKAPLVLETVALNLDVFFTPYRLNKSKMFLLLPFTFLNGFDEIWRSAKPSLKRALTPPNRCSAQTSGNIAAFIF